MARDKPPKLSRRPLMDFHPPNRYIYHPGRHIDTPPPSVIEVLIPPEHFITSNPALQTRQLWGSGEYTDDSDLVAIIAHTFGGLPTFPLPVDYVRATIETCNGSLPSATQRNGLLSRNFSVYQGVLLRVVDVDTGLPKRTRVTYVPLQADMGKGRVTQLAHVMTFNLSSDPCLRYDVRLVCTLGESWLSRLDEEVLYVEGEDDRYEIRATKRPNIQFSRVHRQAIQRQLFGHTPSVPLEESDLTSIANNVSWTHLYWDANGLHLDGNYYTLCKLFFRQFTK